MRAELALQNAGRGLHTAKSGLVRFEIGVETRDQVAALAGFGVLQDRKESSQGTDPLVGRLQYLRVCIGLVGFSMAYREGAHEKCDQENHDPGPLRISAPDHG